MTLPALVDAGVPGLGGGFEFLGDLAVFVFHVVLFGHVFVEVGQVDFVFGGRAGEQTGEFEYQLVNRTPPSARPSRCGVLRSAAPMHDRSP